MQTAVAADELQARIREGAGRLGLELGPAQSAQLLDYIREMQRWGKAYNLTAIRELPQMVSHHLLDSLSVLPHVRGERLLDLGAGAGLPGLPLAIVSPGLQVWLLEAAAKKCRFLRHVIGRLGLTNAQVVQRRAEHYRPEEGFDTVVCRAVATVGQLMEWSAHLCRPGGTLLAMKGQYPTGELAAAAAVEGWRVDEVIELRVPGLDAERHLVVCTRI